MNPAVVFFGELLVRLAPPAPQRFLQATSFDVGYTGAEANAAVSLAQFGTATHMVSAVPHHALGQACVNHFRRFGVGTEHVLRQGERLGIFYLELGASHRPSTVIYDRAGSGFTELRPGDLDWRTILEGKTWLHWSGTAPALAPQLPFVVDEALVVARRLGLTVSCDLNYRSRLWTPEAARAALQPLMSNVDVLIGNEEHIGLILEETGASADTQGADEDPERERADDLSRKLQKRFGFAHVAITSRTSLGENACGWRGFLSNGLDTRASRRYPIVPVDAVGGGDAFTAGLIHGLTAGLGLQDTVDFATAAGCLKHSVPGDLNFASREEVWALVHGESATRIRR